MIRTAFSSFNIVLVARRLGIPSRADLNPSILFPVLMCDLYIATPVGAVFNPFLPVRVEMTDKCVAIRPRAPALSAPALANPEWPVCPERVLHLQLESHT